LSDGDHVSLGFYEKQDLLSIISFLQELGTVSKISLWGRSMGAATSLMYSSQGDNSITSMVVDSPFTSLEEIIKDLVHGVQNWVPNAAVKLATSAMRRSIVTKAR
jgi:pimeloyl-ACP methyl ester carboxylesterase